MKIISAFATICVFLRLASTTTIVSARQVRNGEELLEYINKDPEATVPSPRIHIPNASAAVATPIFASEEIPETNHESEKSVKRLPSNFSDEISATSRNESEKAAISAPKIQVPKIDPSMAVKPFLRRFDPTENLTQGGASVLEEFVRDAFDEIHKGPEIDSVAKIVEAAARHSISNNERTVKGTRPLLRGSHRGPSIPIDEKVLKKFRDKNNWKGV